MDIDRLAEIVDQKFEKLYTQTNRNHEQVGTRLTVLETKFDVAEEAIKKHQSGCDKLNHLADRVDRHVNDTNRHEPQLALSGKELVKVVLTAVIIIGSIGYIVYEAIK